MSARRIVLRREWISQHPPQFNRTRRVEALGLKVRPRLTFAMWMIKTFQPERWAELERIARGEEKKAEKETAQRAADEAREKFEEVIA